MIGLKICLVNCSTWSFVSSAVALCFLLQCVFPLLVLFVDSVDVREEVRGRVYDTVGVTECTSGPCSWQNVLSFSGFKGFVIVK